MSNLGQTSLSGPVRLFCGYSDYNLSPDNKPPERWLEDMLNTSCMKRFHQLLQAVQCGISTTAFCPWSLSYRLLSCSFEMGIQSQSTVDISLLTPLTLLAKYSLTRQPNTPAQVQWKKRVFFLLSLFRRNASPNLKKKKQNRLQAAVRYEKCQRDYNYIILHAIEFGYSRNFKLGTQYPVELTRLEIKIHSPLKSPIIQTQLCVYTWLHKITLLSYWCI